MKGIDISEHNGVIDFNKLKNEVDFVMVRAGFGARVSNGNFPRSNYG